MANTNRIPRLPRMGRHSTGRARVTLNGRVHYLGTFGSLEAQQRYAALLSEWEAGGRRPIRPAATVEQARRLRDLCTDFYDYVCASGRYLKDGKPTSQRKILKKALDEFCAQPIAERRSQCGDLAVADFSAALLLRHRDALERRPRLTRGGINKKIAHIRAALRWARDRGMLTRDQWLDVAEIRPLTRHECGGRDWKLPKRAVTPEEVAQVASEASPQVARMMRVQAAIGCRPGELCAMRWSDLSPATIDVDGVACRVYTVASAKNAHHGRPPTTYALPPNVVEMLGTPTGPGAFVFPSPVTSGGWHPHAYGNAIARACVLAGVPHFGPHQIRHGFLTRAAQRFGVLAASAAANHADTRCTSAYLHTDRRDGYRVVVGLNASAVG